LSLRSGLLGRKGLSIRSSAVGGADRPLQSGLLGGTGQSFGRSGRQNGSSLSIGLARRNGIVQSVGFLGGLGPCPLGRAQLGGLDGFPRSGLLDRETLFSGRVAGREGLCLSVGLARQRDAVASVGCSAEKSRSGSARHNGRHSRSGLLGRETLFITSGCWQRRAPSLSRACSAER
jgi:hypothetical protein